MRKRLIVILLICAVVVAAAIVAILITQSGGDAPAADPTPEVVSVTPSPEPSPAPEASDAVVSFESVADALLSSASPEELVRYYFESWNAKNTAEMDACRIEADRGLYSYSDLPLEESIELISISETPKDEAIANYRQEWFSEPADITRILASFVVNYNEDGQAEYLRATVSHEDYQFWLIKETPQSGWRIVIQGY